MNQFDKIRVDYQAVHNSKKWFDEQVKSIAKAKVTPGKIVGSSDHSLSVGPGNLYFFMYDPKTKETLPYYDQFPLVFPYKAVPGGFMGLNMHYLDYPLRFKLFQKLVGIQSSKIDDRTKLRFSWSTISAMSALNLAAPCVKHYLLDHVKTPFCKVKPVDWTTAMLMPVERFVGASKAKVWSDSR